MSLHATDIRSAAAALPRPLSPAPAPTGPMAVLRVNEPLDLETSPAFLERARSLARSSGCLVVDLGGAEFIDSTGVRALLLLSQELEGPGVDLRLVIGSRSRVERTLGILRLLDRFRVFGAVEEACVRTPPA